MEVKYLVLKTVQQKLFLIKNDLDSLKQVVKNELSLYQKQLQDFGAEICQDRENYEFSIKLELQQKYNDLINKLQQKCAQLEDQSLTGKNIS